MSDRENHPPALGWSIELLIFRSNPDQDFVEDYPEIEDNDCWNPAIEPHHINMVGLARGNSQKELQQVPDHRGI
jgi:hypothetical protein